VIDASTFAHSYNAFWHECAPTCEHFVRRLNLSGLVRWFPPLTQISTSARRALIAEYGFSLFVERRGPVQVSESEPRSQDELAWEQAARRLAPYSLQGLDIRTPLDDEERQEADDVASRLSRVFDHSKPIILRPTFPGCGYVDASEGDLIFGSTLFEVKTVDRPVRSGDIKQAITYAALNAASQPSRFGIRGIGLFNPRRGQLLDVEIDEVCSEISGRASEELFELIVQAWSSIGISR
jgi:hypothetical protein